MPVESILDAARAGLAHERARMEAASRNVATANVAIPTGQAAQKWAAVSAPAGHDAGAAHLGRVDAPERVVTDPGHPLADAQGQVRYPDVDLVSEMTTLMTASRGYEANVRSFNLLRSMMLRALEIGAK